MGINSNHAMTVFNFMRRGITIFYFYVYKPFHQKLKEVPF